MEPSAGHSQSPLAGQQAAESDTGTDMDIDTEDASNHTRTPPAPLHGQEHLQATSAPAEAFGGGAMAAGGSRRPPPGQQAMAPRGMGLDWHEEYRRCCSCLGCEYEVRSVRPPAAARARHPSLGPALPCTRLGHPIATVLDWTRTACYVM